MKIVELKKAMDARFEQVDARFAQVDAHFETLETRLATEHETTRRHMKMLADQLKAEYRLGFDRMLATDQRLASLDAVIPANTGRLRRSSMITNIESSRSNVAPRPPIARQRPADNAPSRRRNGV